MEEWRVWRLTLRLWLWVSFTLRLDLRLRLREWRFSVDGIEVESVSGCRWVTNVTLFEREFEVESGFQIKDWCGWVFGLECGWMSLTHT